MAHNAASLQKYDRLQLEEDGDNDQRVLAGKRQHVANEDDDFDSTSVSTLTPSTGDFSPASQRHCSPMHYEKMDSDQDNDEVERGKRPTDGLQLGLGESSESSESSGNDGVTGGSITDEQGEKLFEVDEIVGHKKLRGQDQWRVRWVGFGPDDDTWEPTENLIGENALRMLEEFKEREEVRKKQRKEMTRRSLEYKKQRQKEKLEASRRSETSSSEDEAKKEEDDEEGIDDSNVEGWFGIKRGQGNREQKRLFVADRWISKTEKLLTEIASPGVRVLRNHLKEQTGTGMAEKGGGSRLSSVEKVMALARKRGRPPKSIQKKKLIESGSDVFTSESSPALIRTDGSKKKRGRKILAVADGEEEEESTSQPRIEELKLDEPSKTYQEEQPQQEPREMTQFEQKIKVEKPKIRGRMQVSGRPVKTVEDKEFGISRKLKPTFAKKTTSKKDSSKRAKEEEGASFPVVKTEHKVRKEKKQKHLTKPVDLSLKSMTEGANIGLELGKILQARKSRTVGQKLDECSQQQFEEIVMDGKVEKVRDLLHQNAQKSFLDLNHVDDFGKTLIHKLCEIKCGVTHTQCELIDVLVSHGARLNIRETNNGQIPLQLAIANRRLCHVQKLLSLRTPVNLSDRNNRTPILLALESSDQAFLKFLLRAGASFHIALEKVYRDKDRYKRQMRLINEHETRLQRALNSARDLVSTNMSVRCISPIFVNPIHEGEVMQNFQLSTQPQLPSEDHAYMLLFGIAEFTADERDKEFCCTVGVRMWGGKCPVKIVAMNGKECGQLKPGNNFAYFCVPQRDQNQLRIRMDPQMKRSNLMLLSQMVLAQFNSS